MHPKSLLRILLVTLTVSVGGLMMTGCGTTSGGYDDEESDLPWSTPESWEGSPAIPGFENR